MSWKPCQHCRLAAAIWNFDKEGEHYLPLSVGDLVCVLEELAGWYRGYLYHYPSRKGIIPANYVQPLDYQIISAGEEDYPVPQIDSIALEAKESLFEWKEKLFTSYATGSRQKYIQILNYMEDVLQWRSNLLYSAQTSVTHDKLQDMRTRLSAKIDLVNQLCELPLTPRDNNGRVIDPLTTSIQKIFTTHKLRQNEVQRRVPQTGWDQKKTKEPISSKAHHLYLVVRNIDHQFPEESELFMFLFDGETRKQVSERFLINVSKGGPSDSPPRRRDSTTPVQHYCIFTDLGAKEMQSQSLYVVCQVIRKGKMLLDDKKHISSYPFRRPYAVGVLDLRTALEESKKQQIDDDDDYQMTYTMPLQICTTHEQDFGTLHLSLIKKSGPKAGGHKQGVMISFALRFIRGDLQKLRKDFPYLINKNAVLVDKLGFPDVILPGAVRNDIYVTLEHGYFEKGSKRAERNVEVAIAVCGKRGGIVPSCIIPAAGATPLSEYESFIYYHHNQPKWQETFKLSIPFDDIPHCHLRIGFRHVAKSEGKDKMEKTFAFSYLKIMKDNGAIIPDGIHELYVYKADSKKWHDPNFYLNVESAKEIGMHSVTTGRDKTGRGKTLSTISMEGTPFSGQSVSRSQRETVYISTLTCSTKLTQKVEMLLLLKWRQKQPPEIPSILGNVIFIDGEEIVKFLQDTLDSLFDILASNSQNYGEPVFKALVAIFSLLSDERYTHFVPVLDIYITQHFSATHAYKTLLWFYDRYLIDHRDIKKHPQLNSLVKSTKFLFQFIIQSYILYTHSKSDPTFHQSLEKYFASISQILSVPESRCHGIHDIQAALLRNLPSILPELSKVYTKRQLAFTLAKVIDSIQNDHLILPGEKMNFIIAICDSEIELLNPQDAREALLPIIVGHMISHIENKMPNNGYRSDEPGNIGCLQCIGKVQEILHSGDALHINFTDIENATPLLLPLLKLCKTLQNTRNPLKVESLINLIGLLRVMSDNHYAIFLDSMKEAEKEREKQTNDSPLRNFISDLLDVLDNLVKDSAHPSHWVIMHFTQNSIVMRVLKNISIALFSCFFKDRDFIPQIWDVFFGMCRTFATQPCLQLEIYSDMLRAKLIRQFGDSRVHIGRHVAAMWHRLAEKKGNFIPDFIGPFLEISLLKDRELRSVSIPLIFDVMKHELGCSGNFKRVETEVFDKMDHLVSNGYGDEAYRDIFHESMTTLCDDDDELREAGLVFVDTVSRLIGLILDYRSVQGDSSHRGKRMGCMLNLLNFYKEIDKEELYIRYIYKLAELHERDANFTEAGLTLLLHAKPLEWSLDIIPIVEGKYPTQFARQRKEQLYLDAIKLLDDGKSWECGIPLCKELASVYETQLYDYEKLSNILRTQADFFHKIITELRVENEYFVVGYFGKGFPLFVRNKVFIHRGQPYERLQAFLKRLTDEFPSAQIYMASEAPDNDIKNSNGMYLQVRKVLPISEEKPEFKGLQIPDKITNYYKTNDVSKFQYDRPFHKGKKDPECEFATLWIERTSYRITSSFPGVINWFEVCETETRELNPLDIAKETVSSKVKEITNLITEVSSNSTMNINPLSMLLKGVIDAAVMGGISHYDKIFFQPNYIQDHPEHIEGVEELRALIVEQVDVLKHGLLLHSQRVPPDLVAFHQDLEMRFEMFQDIVFPERRKSSASRKPPATGAVNRPLPPTPDGLLEEGPLSIPKRPTRRLTGGNPHKVPNSLEPTKIKRSQTTRGPRNSSTISTSSSPDRQSMYSENSDDQLSSVTSYQRESVISSDTIDEECRGDYERVDFESQKQINPAPSYPPPPLPQQPESGYHSYAFIDIEDDDDYEKVKLGINQPKTYEANPEFASPTILRGLPRNKSPSDSPPRKRSLKDRIKALGQSSAVSPAPQPASPLSTSPTETHLSPMIFSKSKSPSPLSTSASDTDPVFDDVQSIRDKLLKQAEEAVRAEIGSPPKPTEKKKQLTQSYNETSPAKLTDYDHLESMKETVLSSDNQNEIVGMYSLANEWSEENQPKSTPQSTVLSPTSREGVFASYDVIKSPPPEETTPTVSPSKKAGTPPKPPMPYSPRKSPTPTPPNGGITSSTSSTNPPPLPRKKTAPKLPAGEVSSTTSSGNQSKIQDVPRPIFSPKEKPPQLQSRGRSQTVALDRKSQNYSTTAPVPVPRKTVPSYSSVELDISSSVTSDVFYDSPPPRPPKPSSSFSGNNPPALPPKAKYEVPKLPPRPLKPSRQDSSSSVPSIPPRKPPPPVNR